MEGSVTLRRTKTGAAIERYLSELAGSSVLLLSRGEHRERDAGLRALARSGKRGSVAAEKRLARLRRRYGKRRVANAQLIRWHAAGAGAYPARDWVAAMRDTRASRLRQIIEDAVGRVMSGARFTPRDAHRLVGKVAREEMVRTLRARISPPLSAGTMADPDRDRRYIPLLDTGQLERSLDTASEWGGR